MFAEDWEFCCGEQLTGDIWFPELQPEGKISTIGIVDGPDEDMEVMPVALFAALSSAKRSVKILTPYFLPTDILLAALRLCAVRQVSVTIITPAQNNIPVVSWAAKTLYPELLRAGCRIHESPAPFDHSKLLLVDEDWALVGSTNWDPRSLRLNFEFNVATKDREFASKLGEIFDAKLEEAPEVTLASLDDLSHFERFRNGIARLFKSVL